MASRDNKNRSLSRSNKPSDSILARVSDSSSSIVRQGKSAACRAAYVAKRLTKSTGKAAWIVATSFLVLGLPLIIEMDREAQFNELDLQQATLLGTPAPHSSMGPPF